MKQVHSTIQQVNFYDPTVGAIWNDYKAIKMTYKQCIRLTQTKETSRYSNDLHDGLNQKDGTASGIRGN
jgi:hypothetical protein